MYMLYRRAVSRPQLQLSINKDDIKKAFDIMNTVADGVSSFKKLEKIKKGSGKKGDDGNPKDRSKLRPSTGGASGSGVNRLRPTRSKCRLAAPKTERLGTAKNTLRIKSCKNDKTRTSELIVTSLDYGSNPKPLPVTKTCDQAYAQACYHYSSAISNNAQWSTLACPTEAASTKNPRLHAQATAVWSSQHRGKGWQDKQAKGRTWANCDRDEYPPAYLLSQNDPAYIFSGSSTAGQPVRYIPNSQNQGAGQMWKSSCFTPVVAGLSDKAFMDAVERAPGKNKKTVKKNAEFEQTMTAITVDTRPEFSITSWGQPKAPRDGLQFNPCWPKGIVPNDPGQQSPTV